mmetsp:Transcript_68051/g.171586  ORF Transcript_68051/g.171586 Transcript_68051/m.171586 type:complete len:376 (+) Transcript_68051:522-1649(+)
MKRAFRLSRTSSNSRSTSSMSLRACAALCAAPSACSTSSLSCSTAFMFGWSRSNSCPKRSNSERYSSSKRATPGPSRTARFCAGSAPKSTTSSRSRVGGPSPPSPPPPSLASSSSREAWSPSRGSLMFSNTLCCTRSPRSCCNSCASAASAARWRFASAARCWASRASWPALAAARSFSRSTPCRLLTSAFSLSRRSWAASAVSNCRPFASSSDLICSSHSEMALLGSRKARSLRVCCTISNSAPMLPLRCSRTRCLASNSSRLCRKSLSSLATSSTPMAALSCAKWPRTTSPICCSRPRCSWRCWASSSSRRWASGRSLAISSSNLCMSSLRAASSCWHCSRAFLLELARASDRIASSCRAAWFVPAVLSSVWI